MMTEFNSQPSAAVDKNGVQIRLSGDECEKIRIDQESEFFPSRFYRSSIYQGNNNSRNSELSGGNGSIMVDVGADLPLPYCFATPLLMTEAQSTVKCEEDDCCESTFCTRCLSTSSDDSVDQSPSSVDDEHVGGCSSPFGGGGGALPSPISAVMNYVPLAAASAAMSTVAPPNGCFQHNSSTVSLPMVGNLLPEAAHFVTLPMSGGETHHICHHYQSSMCESFPTNDSNTRTAQQRHSAINVLASEDFQIVPNLHNLTMPQHTSMNNFNETGLMRNDGGAARTANGSLLYPVDLVMQERAKLERKRARNRAAATKCRHKKLERIRSLQAEVRHITNKNGNIVSEIDGCRQEIKYLRDLIYVHEMRGCSIDLDGSGEFAANFVGHHTSILSP